MKIERLDQRYKIKMSAIRQFLGIALLCTYVIGNARGQVLWDVTGPDAGHVGQYFFQCISSSGNTCSAVGQIQDADTAALRTMFWRSDDAGRTWAAQDPKLSLSSLPAATGMDTKGQLNSIQQIDSLNAIAVGTGGLILSSHDGGKTWKREQCSSISSLQEVHCSSSTEGIIVGVNPPVILIRDEVGWVTVPFRPSVESLTYRIVWMRSIYGHSYGAGAYRVICNQSYSINQQTTPVVLYTTTDSWKSVDSTFVPLWSVDNSSGGKFLQASFGHGDTMMISGTCQLRNSLGYGALTTTVDGGAHWVRTFDSASHHGFLLQSTPDHDTILSWVMDSGRFYNPACESYMQWSTDRGSTWKRDTVLFNLPSVVSAGYFRSVITSDGSIVFICGTALFRLHTLPHAGVSLLGNPVESLQVYPNPTTGLLHVEPWDHRSTVFDPLGRQYAVPVHEGTLDVSRLPAGVYCISDGLSRVKFVKE